MLKEIGWFDIFLTLIGSNMVSYEENILFPTFEVKGRAYLDLSDNEFIERFSHIPESVCSEIYEKMLEMNPWWRIETRKVPV